MIQVKDKFFVPYKGEEEILDAICDLAGELNRENEDYPDEPVFVCIMNGALFFASELLQRLHFNYQYETLRASSYLGVKSTGLVELGERIKTNLAGRRVYILEDIVDTGTTIAQVGAYLKAAGAKSVEVYTMLFKPTAYKGGVFPIHAGLEIENKFVVGYGLDYDGEGRNLQDLYQLAD